MRRFIPKPEPLEQKLALSTPTISTHAYRSALHGIHNALGTLAKTKDFAQADATLTRIAGTILYGKARLLPIWEHELASISLQSRGSGLRAQQDIRISLQAHLHRGIKAGALQVTGPAGRQLASPRLDNLNQGLLIANDSNQTIAVTLSKGDKVLDRNTVVPNGRLYIENSPQAFPHTAPYLLSIATVNDNQEGNRTGLELNEISGKTVIVREDQIGRLVHTVENSGFPGT